MSCAHCPRRGNPCRGEEIPRLCQLVNPARADFNPGYRNLLAPVPAAEARPGDPDNPPDHSSQEIRHPAAPGLAETLRLTMLARRCPYRSRPSCSCQGAAACALKRADVSAATCWDCVRRYGV